MGVQGQKSWKHDSEITGDPKGPPIGSTFWSGFESFFRTQKIENGKLGQKPGFVNTNR